jgi:hypothetical protein
MNKKVIPLIVQLKQNNNFIVQGIAQNDAGVIFDIKIMDGLESFNFAGYGVITLKIQKPDETFTYDSNTGTYLDIIDPVNGRLKINIPTSCTAQNGMHFCSVSFAHSNDTIFETMSFNYFVGTNPNADNDDVIGTNEFPVLTNLIAEVSGIIADENNRVNAENDREEAEAIREAEYQQMMESLSTALTTLENAITDAEGMLTQVYEALAQGASISIGDITKFATKTYVGQQLARLDFGPNRLTGLKTNVLKIFCATTSQITDGQYQFEEGELVFDTVTNKLYVCNGDEDLVMINEPDIVSGSTAPTDTSKLWIDTSGSVPVAKYYNGTAWVSCNNATYA